MSEPVKTLPAKGQSQQQAAAPQTQRMAVEEALAVLRDSGVLDLLKGQAAGPQVVGQTNPQAVYVTTADEAQQAKSKAELDALRKLLETTPKQRTQMVADAKYKGAKKFSVVLPDGNGHPELIIAADERIDAIGRYNEVCGIMSAEKKHVVSEAA